MGWLRQKKYFGWYEPVAINRRQMQLAWNMWRFLASTAITVACIMMLWFLRDGGQKRPWFEALQISLYCSLGLLVFVNIVYWLAPRQVLVFEKDIRVIQGQGGLVLKYSKIDRAEFVNEYVAGREFIVLHLFDSRGRQHKVGLSTKVSADDLGRHLQERGVAVRWKDGSR